MKRDGGTGKRPARLRPFLSTLIGNNRRRFVWVVTIQVLAALSQGIGFLLLVPLLSVAGVGRTSSTGGVVAWTRNAFATVGVPLTLESMLVAYAVLVAIAAGLNGYQQVLSTRYRLEFVDDLRRRLYGTIARAEWRHLLTVRQSDLLTALTADVGWVSQGTLATLALGASTVVIAVQVAVALRISLAMTALAAGTGALLTVLVWPLVLRSRRLGEELVGHNHRLLASVTGFFDGLKLARAHGREASHVQGFDDAMRSVRRSQIAFAKAQAAASALQLIVTGVVLAVLVDVAINGLGMRLPELLVLAFIFTRLVPQINTAQTWVQQLAQALPHFDAVSEVIDECDRAAEPQPPQATARQPRVTVRNGIRLDDVTFAYQGPDGTPVDVLRDVTFDIPARTTTALVGPSGAGKTTIADLVVGLLAPTSGDVLIDGEPLRGELVGRWREALAMVPQEPFLFHESVRANLLWANPEATEDDLWQALRVAAAEEFVSRLPDGLDTVVGDRGGRMSGGERQRIALARAVLRKPELLVLDEATTSLDADNENAILDALAALHGQMTVLVISHQRTTLRNADRVVRLDGGRVVDLASL